jgi:hypothetical protein
MGFLITLKFVDNLLKEVFVFVFLSYQQSLELLTASSTLKNTGIN